ncbi:MAG: hypothetical protein COV60_00885 [Candidatus Magasanikbacteria bacterium CG11_big_fil_rev_8_21_14_0_20_43_7]|uniref:Uncharacterized protein n=1 Tax=Candidatus Magasanikbacteria bacterium CG11_big_fil_rev_8_21_14_0_20_43_7 TaxID=1974654 RepID=A0A2H0N361_9BACT|nr:MAG: hypothetical protein COV60_00885 [Candidatus Magasanikbacteria bacterium CG11_big_fil_rev_8_21_14_0_20_43_7]
MNIQTTLLNAVLSYDAKGKQNEFFASIEQAIQNVTTAQRPLSLLSFTCSTIQSEYMCSDTPWMYVDTNVEGNNLSQDLKQLTKIITALRKIYPTDITILIGNTDPYYIYLQQFKNYTDKDSIWNEFEKRWNTYKQNLTEWISETYPTLQATVISWYEWEKQIEIEKGISFEAEYEDTLQRLDDYVDQKNIDWELQQLKTQFVAGKYFEQLLMPHEDILKDWVRRKFTEYAVQATWIYRYMPNSMLIQNEKPSDLRSQMYQPLIQKMYDDVLSIVYFFGVDNQGYQ